MNIAESLILKVNKESTGVAVFIDHENKLKIHVAVLIKCGANLKVKRQSSYGCLEDAKEAIQPGNPIVVSVDGYGIIHKQLEPGDNNGNISAILPNVKTTDLYIQRIEQENNGKTFLSIARKDKINELISLFNDAGLYLYKIILGPFNIMNLFPLMQDEKEIVIPGYSFRVNDDLTISFKREDNSLINNTFFGDDMVSSEYIIPVANGISYFSSTMNIHDNITSISTQKKEFLSRKCFKVYSVLILLAVFILLAANVLLYSRYRSENLKLNNTISFNKELVQRADSIKKEIKEKQALSEIYNDKESRMFSYYADRIASAIPSYVTLTRISVNPSIKSYQSQGSISFKKDFITLTGLITGTGDLDLMIKRISSFDWVENVAIENYIDTENNPAIFEIEIKTR